MRRDLGPAVTIIAAPPGALGEGGRTKVDLYEYQARDMFARHGVPVLDAYVATTPDEARAGAQRLGGGTVVVKAQVKTGGRGKAGGVKLAHNPAEALGRCPGLVRRGGDVGVQHRNTVPREQVPRLVLVQVHPLGLPRLAA